MNSITDYYRLPGGLLDAVPLKVNSGAATSGYFQFDSNVCYGQSAIGTTSDSASSAQFEALKGIRREAGCLNLPFDFDAVIDNLRQERYRKKGTGGLERFASNEAIRKFYYAIRKTLPFPVRRGLQKLYFSDWKDIQFPAWPVDFTVDNLHRQFLKLLMEVNGINRLPFIWFWPNGASNALIMTHDVETAAGRDYTSKLLELDDAFGIKASYQAIPEKRYEVSNSYVEEIRRRGCEFNIHDLNHDGHLYRERSEFERRAAEINRYGHQYGARGFRAGAMYRNQSWYDVFEFSYDMSVPNVAHLEPLRGGCCTVMPYFIGKIVELPLTTTQDYSLFHILDDYSIELWKQELALLRENNGLISLLAHPDYLIQARERKVYQNLLEYLQQMISREKIWATLPGEVDLWWRARNKMSLVARHDGGGNIEGPGKDKATLAYAVLGPGGLTYEIGSSGERTATV
jgi:hypothetical protein